MYQPTAARWFPAVLTLLRIIALALTLVSASLSFAQADQPTAPTLSQDPWDKKIISIDWKDYFFEEIAQFDDEKQLLLLGGVKKPLDKIALGSYLEKAAELKIQAIKKEREATQREILESDKRLQAKEQEILESDKRLQAKDQEILESDKRLQAIEQEGHEIDKRLQAKEQEILEKKKRLQAKEQEILEKKKRLQAKEQEIAEGLLILEKNIRAVLGAGGKLPKGHRETLELVWKEGTPEQAAYFKSVLQNPNNFSK